MGNLTEIIAVACDECGGAGFLTINDVRRLEDLTPIMDPSADTVRVPLANVNIDAADLSLALTSGSIDVCAWYFAKG